MKVKLVGGPNDGMMFDIDGANARDGAEWKKSNVVLPQGLMFLKFPQPSDIETATEASASAAGAAISHQYDLYRATGECVEYIHRLK